MEEPQKRPLNPDKSASKEPQKIPLPPFQHLYDDFGYLLSIEKKYPEPMVDDLYIRPDNDSVYTPIQNLEDENSKNSN